MTELTLRSVLKYLRVLLLAAVLAVEVVPLVAAAEPTVVVVDRDNPKTDISVDDLRMVFLGKRESWPDGARVVVMDLDWGPVRTAFSSAVLGMNQGQVERWWVDQKVRGEGTAPKVASSPGSAVRLVSKVRGAVAYVPQSQADASVKILTIGGKGPGQPGYPMN